MLGVTGQRLAPYECEDPFVDEPRQHAPPMATCARTARSRFARSRRGHHGAEPRAASQPRRSNHEGWVGRERIRVGPRRARLAGRLAGVHASFSPVAIPGRSPPEDYWSVRGGVLVDPAILHDKDEVLDWFLLELDFGQWIA